jgi:hypothetical protein
MKPIALVRTIVRYWPAVVAGLHLAYVLSSGNTDQIVSAVTTLVAALGINQMALNAHTRLDRFMYGE